MSWGVWTDPLEERYVVATRSYGVAVYRRRDGARMGGFRDLAEAAAALAGDPVPDGSGPPLHPDVRDHPSPKVGCEIEDSDLAETPRLFRVLPDVDTPPGGAAIYRLELLDGSGGLEPDEGNQIVALHRVTDHDKVAAMADTLRRGESLPPIAVFGCIQAAEGTHRLAAAAITGHPLGLVFADEDVYLRALQAAGVADLDDLDGPEMWGIFAAALRGLPRDAD